MQRSVCAVGYISVTKPWAAVGSDVLSVIEVLVSELLAVQSLLVRSRTHRATGSGREGNSTHTSGSL